jgi:hypothetical protein
MDFELPEELAEVQKLAHDFAEKEIAPGAACNLRCGSGLPGKLPALEQAP